MTRKIPFLLLLSFLATNAVAATGRYMVVTRTAPAATRMATHSEEMVARRARPLTNIPAFGIDLTEEEAAELRNSPDVVSVTPVVERRAMGGFAPVPHVSRFAKQQMPWGVSAVGAPEVWPATRGANVNVAVIDTGIDPSHPDLTAAYAGGVNIVEPEKLPLDDHGHGTHVAGTIAAADDATGVVGVAPGAKLWSVKVLDQNGYGTDESVALGMDWVISKAQEVGGRWIMNLSLGSTAISPAEQQAVQRAIDSGVITIAASGNDGWYHMIFPAAYRGVISVGALDQTFEPAEFSNYNVRMTITAPGVDVPSTYIPDKILAADVETPTDILQAYSIAGSSLGSATGQLVECGYGRPEEFPPHVAGNIAVIQRGPLGNALTFRDKSANAKRAGAKAVVIYNDDDLRADWAGGWTMIFTPTTPEWENFQFPITVAISRATATKLLASSGKTATARLERERFARMQGTSMATPHVSGVVAMLLALAPEMNHAQVEHVIRQTAKDVSYPGWDLRTGNGMVDALAAAKYVAPQAFGLPPNEPQPVRRRSAGR